MPEKTLLFHACCGPCATTGVHALTEEGWNIALYFYGGNIQPCDEWQRRLEALRKLADSYRIPLIVRPYDTSEWDRRTAGLENEREGGRRCERCIRLQLESAAQKAAGLSLTTLCTSLTLSPQKHPRLINAWGAELAGRYALDWEGRIWRKKDGQLFSVRECKRLGLYRQNYCGCRYSMERLNHF